MDADIYINAESPVENIVQPSNAVHSAAITSNAGLPTEFDEFVECELEEEVNIICKQVNLTYCPISFSDTYSLPGIFCIHYAGYTVYCILYTVYCILYTVYCILYILKAYFCFHPPPLFFIYILSAKCLL